MIYSPRVYAGAAGIQTLTPSDQLRDIRLRLARACERAGRDAASVTLLGASKTVDAGALREFLKAGLAEVGENYVQEGVRKMAELGADATAARWHLIGSLQSNKARQAVAAFDLIHSVDRISLAKALDQAACEVGKTQHILLQVNLGAEASKAGCRPAELQALARGCQGLPNLRVVGLMCLPPYDPDPERVRPFFKRLRELKDELQQQGLLPLDAQLSMGMSNDFEVAVAEGATLVRIGTALFGERTKT